MAAAGLRPCHLTGSRNSTVSQFNAGNLTIQQSPQIQLVNKRLLKQSRQQMGSSCALSSQSGSASQTNLLLAANNSSDLTTNNFNNIADDRRLVMSQQKLNLICMIQFATSLMNALNGINKQSFQLFKLRVGVNAGPVIAGVIGAQRPFYDIWGDCVNVSLLI